MMAQRIDHKGLLLGDLLAGIVDAGEYGRQVIIGVSQDSRNVQEGTLFMAVAGQSVHGMDYLSQAVTKGASAILAEPGGAWERARLAEAAGRVNLPLFMVSGLKEKVGVIASRFFGYPGQALRVVGVTGTNGKTSVTHFLAQALSPRVPTGVLGTLGNGVLGDLRATTHTTPDAVAVQAELARQLRLGVKAVVMEVSSHALDQGRVKGIPFHTAVFTNLSHEHLDYHGSMSAYAAAKSRLLRHRGLMTAVINADDSWGRQLLQEAGARVMSVACSMQKRPAVLADRFVHARRVELLPEGLRLAFDSSWGEGEFSSRLLGRFNAQNLLLALAVLLSWDMPLPAALDALSSLDPVPGRMNLLGGEGGPRVVVDFAHTQDALAQVLSTLREHVKGRLVCVFGCGGERDRDKRPRMGELAQRLADRVIVTDDNPRGEDPDEIVAQILAGMRDTAAVVVERDRARAIAQAVADAGPDDLVLLAGKGHETWQLVGERRIPFSDLEQAQKALQERAA